MVLNLITDKKARSVSESIEINYRYYISVDVFTLIFY